MALFYQTSGPGVKAAAPAGAGVMFKMLHLVYSYFRKSSGRAGYTLDQGFEEDWKK
jgi:hypothetical protein